MPEMSRKEVIRILKAEYDITAPIEPYNDRKTANQRAISDLEMMERVENNVVDIPKPITHISDGCVMNNEKYYMVEQVVNYKNLHNAKLAERLSGIWDIIVDKLSYRNLTGGKQREAAADEIAKAIITHLTAEEK